MHQSGESNLTTEFSALVRGELWDLGSLPVTLNAYSSHPPIHLVARKSLWKSHESEGLNLGPSDLPAIKLMLGSISQGGSQSFHYLPSSSPIHLGKKTV
jgi:hypothetical protein